MLDNICQSNIPISKIEYYKVISPIHLTYDIDRFPIFIAILSNVLLYKTLLSLYLTNNTLTVPIYINKSYYIDVDVYEKYYNLGIINKGNTLQIKYNNVYARTQQNNDNIMYITNNKLFDILENGNQHFAGLHILNNIRDQINNSLDLIYYTSYGINKELLSHKNVFEIANYIYLSEWSNVDIEVAK